jgi:hypothetical protein
MKADINYNRVLPRDLFNEAKLLKCIGRLILLIEDNMTPVRMSYGENGEPFTIGLTDDGSLMVTNLGISINRRLQTFKTTYNSKSNYPLLLETPDYSEILVFSENGEFTPDFIQYAINIK